MTELAMPRSVAVFDWLNARTRQIAVAAVGLSLLLAGGYAIMLGNELRYSDEHVYLELTQSLVDGRGFASAPARPHTGRLATRSCCCRSTWSAAATCS